MNKINILLKFVALCYNWYFSPHSSSCSYVMLFIFLLYALFMSEGTSLTIFLIAFWVVNPIHFPLFPFLQNLSFVNCATAANSMCSTSDVFRSPIITVRFDIFLRFMTLAVLINYLSIFCYVFVSCVSCLLYFVICVCMLCSFFYDLMAVDWACLYI